VAVVGALGALEPILGGSGSGKNSPGPLETGEGETRYTGPSMVGDKVPYRGGGGAPKEKR